MRKKCCVVKVGLVSLHIVKYGCVSETQRQKSKAVKQTNKQKPTKYGDMRFPSNHSLVNKTPDEKACFFKVQSRNWEWKLFFRVSGYFSCSQCVLEPWRLNIVVLKGTGKYWSGNVSSREAYWCGIMFILKCLLRAFYIDTIDCAGRLAACLSLCVCVRVKITSDNFLTDEYWVLTFLWIQVSVQSAQQENSKVGQCLRSRSRLLRSLWNVCIRQKWFVFSLS